MLGLNVIAAPTADEARLLFTSLQQAFVNLRTGRAGPLPRPVEDVERHLDPVALASAEQALAITAVGAPDTVRRGLQDLIARYRPDELILTGQIHDHAARLRSFEIAADILGALEYPA